jgi:hypothetical protein
LQFAPRTFPGTRPDPRRPSGGAKHANGRKGPAKHIESERGSN